VSTSLTTGVVVKLARAAVLVLVPALLAACSSPPASSAAGSSTPQPTTASSAPASTSPSASSTSRPRILPASVFPALAGFTFTEATSAEAKIADGLSDARIAGLRMAQVRYRGKVVGGAVVLRQVTAYAPTAVRQAGIDIVTGFVQAKRALRLDVHGQVAWEATKDDKTIVAIGWIDGADSIVVWAKDQAGARFLANAYLA
jgi:hypothetical protein